MQTPNTQLRERRNAFWLTQAELAEQVGVAETSIRRWEAGWQPQPEHVRRLCSVLHASPADLGFHPRGRMAAKRQPFAQRRKAVGYTQESFAERLGVDRNTVVRWEAGATDPQPWMRPTIARALEVSVDELDRLLTEAIEPESATGEHLTLALKHPSRVDLVAAVSDGNSVIRDARVFDVVRGAPANQVVAHGELVLLGTFEPATPGQHSAWPLSPTLHTTAGGETLTDDMNRRGFLHLVSVGVPAAALLPYAGLLAPSGSGRVPLVSEATLDALAEVIAGEKRLCDQLGSRAVLGLATEHVRIATDLLRSAPPATLRPRLAALASEAAAEAGYVHADQRQLPAARSSYQLAAELAQEAENPGLEAFVLGGWCRRLADSHLYAGAHDIGDGAQLLSLVQRAQTAAAQRPSPGTTMYLATIEAEVHACIGNADASLRAQEDADEALSWREPADDAPWLDLGVDDTAYLRATQGYCAMCTGRFGDAEAALTKALSSREASFPAFRARRFIILAFVRLHQQELEDCCLQAGHAVELAAASSSSRMMQRVRDLRVQLQSWEQLPAVKALDEQMAAAPWT